MSLMAKLKKSSTIKETDIITESKIMLEKDSITTQIPAINIALQGSITGGLTPGLTVFAGKSKHFKTLFSLVLAEAYLKKYPEAILLFYDSEFGSPISYFESVGINPDRVLHTPITNIEDLIHDITNQMKSIERGDKVVIIVDSVGNLASSKEVKDAEDGKEVADMTRAKRLKSLFRIVTPHLTMKDIPMIAIGHTYDTLEMYSKAVVSGGTGIYYSSDNIYIIGRQQEKDGTEVVGYNFIINIEKSRFVKEKSKIPITVTAKGGIDKFSGMLDIALELGWVVKPKNGWYAKVNKVTGEIGEKSYRESQTHTEEFWGDILNNVDFQKDVENKFKLSRNALISEDTQEEIVEEVYNTEDDDTDPEV